jgi:hypothetical protein
MTRIEAEKEALDAEAKNLESVGLKFEPDAMFSSKWDEGFLRDFAKTHPEVTGEKMVAALDRYIERGERYLKYCETYREKPVLTPGDARVPSGDDLFFISPKVSLAKKTRASIQEAIDRDRAAKEKKNREMREQEARDAKSPIYPYSAYVTENDVLEAQTAELEKIRIRLPVSQTEVSTRGTDVAGYFDEQKKTMGAETAKAELTAQIQSVISIYAAYLAKFGNFPYRIEREGKQTAIHQESDLPGLERTRDVLKAKISLLEGILQTVLKME